VRPAQHLRSRGRGRRSSRNAPGFAARVPTRPSIDWIGFKRDMPAIMFASDLVVQTSDNEGTPLSLIEVHAAALPVVATDVGGVPSVVIRDRSGTLVAPDDEAWFAEAARRLLDDPERAAHYGPTGQGHVVAGFTVEKLVFNVDRLSAPAGGAAAYARAAAGNMTLSSASSGATVAHASATPSRSVGHPLSRRYFKASDRAERRRAERSSVSWKKRCTSGRSSLRGRARGRSSVPSECVVGTSSKRRPLGSLTQAGAVSDMRGALG
jgi:Glycosyl transferases group 1